MSMSAAWTKSFSHGLQYVEDLNGVAWYDAPKPRRWHRCKAQTRGRFNDLAMDRCACGGVRYVGDDFWIERNSRRK